METENLGQQNATLRMQQALAAKTAEANRLYIVLLLLALAFGTLAMFRLRRSQLRFQRMARLDGLTATLNHQHFMSAAESELARLEKHAMPACLIYLDLDFFKRINDTHGHAAGDEVLQGVAESCRNQLRSADLFGRLGGEEFGILLVDCPRESALDIAERVRQAIASTVVMHGDRLIMVSASVGLVFTDASGYNLRQLRADADAALYRAKDGGRDRLVAANEESGSFVTIGER
jgi:diguanylate cyclase (GGDEF)-like protein